MKSGNYIDKSLFKGLEVKDFRRISEFVFLLDKNIKSDKVWTLYNDCVYIHFHYSFIYIQRRYMNEHNEFDMDVISKNELRMLVRKNKIKKICSKI